MSVYFSWTNSLSTSWNHWWGIRYIHI